MKQKRRKSSAAQPDQQPPAGGTPRRTEAPSSGSNQAAGEAERLRAHDQALNELQGKLGYIFSNLDLLALALTHSSYVYELRLGRAKTSADEPNEPGTDNEQVEFLGDAVLGLAVTEMLLREFPDRSEGELTRIRASLVSRKRMAELGEMLALGDLLQMGKSAEASEGRYRTAVLANSAEALLGAMYLDITRGPDARARVGERALRQVRAVLWRLLVKPDLPAIRVELAAAPGRGAMRDAKSRLQERVQAERVGQLGYVDVEESGPAHARVFTVEARLRAGDGSLRTLARAAGGSKKEAQQAAAAEALNLTDFLAQAPQASPAGQEPA